LSGILPSFGVYFSLQDAPFNFLIGVEKRGLGNVDALPKPFDF
jgi:hypothetical protein